MCRSLLFCLLFLGVLGSASSQTYYVAIVKGKVYYQDELLQRRDKLTLKGKLRFTSASDYVKLSGPGGLHTIRPSGVRTNWRNEFLVALREELFPKARMRATVANNIAVNSTGSYFELNGEGGIFLFPQHYTLDSTRQAEAEDFGLLHATAKGLVWRSLPLDRDGQFTFDSTTFQLPGQLGIDSSAIVLVRDSARWQALLRQHTSLAAVAEVTDNFNRYAPTSITITAEERSYNDSTVQEEEPPLPPPLAAEILDYVRPYHFVNPSAFLEDMRFHVQHTGAQSRNEFLHDFFFDEYIEEEYGAPQGYDQVLEALVPQPHASASWHPMGDAWYNKPLRVGIVGLVHTHVHGLLGREDRGDIEIVGIVEPNRDLAARYCKQYGIPLDQVYDTPEELMAFGRPEAVLGFNTTYDHLALVEYFAPRKVHLMVEKPLAVNLAHAERMVKLAEENYVKLLTNYETSWYGSTAHAYQLLQDSSQLGELTRLLFYTGHQGPIEIGCNTEFLEWLTDPVLNGGGALPDFACYGANLTTYLLQGAEPLNVTCLTRQTKPDKYPKVEDDATIILNYPNEVQVIIQASWNWSHNRKEMELYATDGYIYCRDGEKVEQLLAGQEDAQTLQAEPLPAAINDPFAYLYAVIKQRHEVEPWDVSAPKNNLRVMQILEAAKWSAQEGRTVRWEEFLGHYRGE